MEKTKAPGIKFYFAPMTLTTFLNIRNTAEPTDNLQLELGAAPVTSLCVVPKKTNMSR